MNVSFSAFGFKWFLEIYPFGQGPAERNDVNLYLTMLSIPPNISSIAIHFDLSLEERECAEYGSFEQMASNCMSFGWPSNVLQPADLKGLEAMTLKAKLLLVDVYDDKGIALQHDEKEYDEKAAALSLPTGSHEWRISDDAFISKIRRCKNAEYFVSEIFEIEGLRWSMQICPNGSSPQRRGLFNWYLHLAALPSKVEKVFVFYWISLLETGTVYGYRTFFQCRQPGKGWGNDKLRHSQIMDLETFTFKLDIAIVDVFDAEGRNISDGYRQYLSPPMTPSLMKDQFAWKVEEESMLKKIKSANNGEHFENERFAMCGLLWFFRVYPSGKDKHDDGELKLYLHLDSLPKAIASISCHFQLFVDETETIYSDFAHFRTGFLFDGWQSSRIKTQQIQELDALTIKAEIRVIEVYGEHHMPITQTFASNQKELFL